MTPFILAWLITVLVTADILLVWFKSNFIHEIMMLLKATVWRKKSADFWGVDLTTRMRHEWDIWLSAQAASGEFPEKLVRLITCPICLGTHVLWLTALVASCVLLADHTLRQVVLFFLITSRSGLTVALTLVNHHTRPK